MSMLQAGMVGHTITNAHTGILLFYLFRHSESVAEFLRALEIGPLSLIINLDFADSSITRVNITTPSSN